MDRQEYSRNKTIEDIKQAFMKEYEKAGIDGVRTTAICETGKVSRALFYRYFDDKYDVLSAIEDELIENMIRLNLDLPAASLSEYRQGDPFPVFYETAKYIKENELYFKPFLGANGDARFIYRWKKAIRKQVKEKFEQDRVYYQNIGVVTEMIASSLIGLYTYWFYEEPELSAVEISAIGGNLVCGSFYNFSQPE